MTKNTELGNYGTTFQYSTFGTYKLYFSINEVYFYSNCLCSVRLMQLPSVTVSMHDNSMAKPGSAICMYSVNVTLHG